MSRRANEGPDRPRNWWRRLGAFLVWYLLPGLIVLAALGYTYAALIWHVNPPVVAVQGTSMLPTLKTGELVFLAPPDPSTLKKGDIIAVRVSAQQRTTYDLPANVVHRIVRIEHISTGLLFITKGDNNSGNDVFTTPAANVAGRLKFVVPALGYAFLFGQSREGVIFFVAVAVIGLLYYLFGLIDDRRRVTRDTVRSMQAMLAEAQESQSASRHALNAMSVDADAEARDPIGDEGAVETPAESDLVAPAALDAVGAKPELFGLDDGSSVSPSLASDVAAKSKKKKRDGNAIEGKKVVKSKKTDKGGKKKKKK
ncbi:MAG: signal peptidase I [Acidimicrobiales bacterium]